LNSSSVLGNEDPISHSMSFNSGKPIY